MNGCSSKHGSDICFKNSLDNDKILAGCEKNVSTAVFLTLAVTGLGSITRHQPLFGKGEGRPHTRERRTSSLWRVTRQDIVQAPSTVHRWNLKTQRSAVILVLFEENSGRKIIIAMLSFSKRSAFSKCFRQVWKAFSKSSVFVTDQFVDGRSKFKFFRCGVGQGPQMNLL